MKNNSTFHLFLLTGLLLVFVFSCKKDTPKVVPIISVTSVTNITSTSAISGGEITSDGGESIAVRGICWSVNQNPTTSDNKTSDVGGIGSFSGSISGLSPGMTYNVRAYAVNAIGTGYSSQASFTTLALTPVLSTLDITDITSTTVTSGGNILNDGGSSITARGVCWSTQQNPTIAGTKTSNGTGSGSYISSITGLSPGTTYYIKAYATNSIGTSYGSQKEFGTLSIPKVTTSAVTINTVSSAKSGGYINDYGGANIISCGVCWSTTPNPTITNNKTIDGLIGTSLFNSNLTGLTANTIYYVRAYATNSVGTGYGNENTIILYLNTPSANVSDNDGNVYHTIKIGTQEWMVENLKTTKYNDGHSISNITSNSEWYNLGQGYCWYGNNIINKNVYGALYSFWLIKSSTYGGICPTGWHIPSDAEWSTLTNYLGGESVAGDKLKESGTTHWTSPNTGATNESGFTALPGGSRSANGTFSSLGNYGYWWTSTEYEGFPNYTALCRLLNYNVNNSRYISDETVGMSVRCIKN